MREDTMACPPDLVELIGEMLHYGLLRIRLAGWEGDAATCALEADHLHNLPDLLAHYRPDRLAFYWDAERPLYISRSSTSLQPRWEALWDRMAPLVERERAGPPRGRGRPEV